jgi:ABC-type multidrug transport system fused ATPase/permease subunit
LDASSERIVQQAIDILQQAKSQTTIVIAHRLSTIINSDKILVIDQGKLVEEGTHTELLEKNGLYSQLWMRQSGQDETD